MRKHFNHYRPPAAGSRLRTSPSSPERRIGCSVNTDGNIVLDVKPMGTLIIFR